MPRPEGLHPRVLRELADVTMRLLSMILEVLQQLGKVPEDWEKAKVAPVFGKGRKEIGGSTGWSALLWSLGRGWSRTCWEQGRPKDVVYLGFSQHFDTISH